MILACKLETNHPTDFICPQYVYRRVDSTIVKLPVQHEKVIRDGAKHIHLGYIVVRHRYDRHYS
jgi:hypothetical protein